MTLPPARASRVAPPKPPILEKPAPNQFEFPRLYSRLEVGVKPRTISVEVCRDDKTAIEHFSMWCGRLDSGITPCARKGGFRVASI